MVAVVVLEKISAVALPFLIIGEGRCPFLHRTMVSQGL